MRGPGLKSIYKRFISQEYGLPESLTTSVERGLYLGVMLAWRVCSGGVWEKDLGLFGGDFVLWGSFFVL